MFRSIMLAVFSLGVSPAWSGPSPLHYDDGPCGDDLGECAPDYHRVPGPGSEFANTPWPIHNARKLCLVQGEPAPPEGRHDPCTPTEEDEDYQLAYLQALNAAEEGDISQLVEIAPEAWKHVVLNVRRQSLQILDCGAAHTIANIPLPKDLMAELSSQLAPAR
ncbi:MAG: hypothetical protein PVJ04_16675 [Gemmatimonadota bacterium]